MKWASMPVVTKEDPVAQRITQVLLALPMQHGTGTLLLAIVADPTVAIMADPAPLLRQR